MNLTWRVTNRGTAATSVVCVLTSPKPGVLTPRLASRRKLTMLGARAFEIAGPWPQGSSEVLTIDGADAKTGFVRTFVDGGRSLADRLTTAAATNPPDVAALRRAITAGLPKDSTTAARRFFARLAEEDQTVAFKPVLERMVPLLGTVVVDRAVYTRHGLRTAAARPTADKALVDDVRECVALVRRVAEEAFGVGAPADAQLDAAFERFVSGELVDFVESVNPSMSGPPAEETEAVQGAPNSVLFLYFAELVLLARDLGIDSEAALLPWLRTFVRSAEAFVELYWNHDARTKAAYGWQHRSAAAATYPWALSRARFANRDWDTLDEDFSRLCLFALADTMRRRPFRPHWA